MAQRVSLREINRLALPAIMAGIAEPLISMGDLAIVSRIPHHSVAIVAAVGIASSFLSALIWVLAQTKAAISSAVSRHLGADTLPEIDSLIGQTLALNLFISLAVYALTTWGASWVFSLYNAKGLVHDYAVTYYRIRALGFPLTLFTFTVFGIFRGLQNTIWAMYISIFAGLLNLLLDLLLVFGIDGLIPPMGIRGAAYASLASQASMALLSGYFLLTRTRFSLKVTLPLNRNLRPLVAMSVNLFLRTAVLNLALYWANKYATGYGKHHIAAHTIAMNIWLFSAFFIDGYANAGIALAGKLMGAKDHKRLWHLSWDLVKYASFVALLLSAAYAVGYTVIPRLFHSDPKVLALHGGIFWIVILLQPLNGIAFTFDGIFKGLGKASYLRNLLFAATFLGFYPTLRITDALGLELSAIWLAFTAWLLVRALTHALLFTRRFRPERTL